MSFLWHPFSAMGTVAGAEFVIVRGDGVFVWDDSGNRYFDATAGLWYCQVGHGRSEIADAARAQAEELEAYHVFGDFANRPALELAERISGFAPVPDSKVFLVSGGSDAVDTAAKIARRYFHLTGEADRTVLITRSWSYHGMHGIGTSLSGIEGNADGYGRLIPDIALVPWDSIEDLRATIADLGAERIAGFYCEPVIGAGGLRPPPPGYLKEARRIIDDAGALFIADEVITGFGRCGDWFASSRFSLSPDLVTFAKGVTSGYLPAGGVIAAPRVWEPFYAEDAPMLRHGYTYSGHPTVAAAALANLDIMERERLAEQALKWEAGVVEGLATLEDHPLIVGQRSGVGFLGAAVLDGERIHDDPGLPPRVYAAIRERGVISRVIGGDGLQISPPLTMSEPEFEEMLALIRLGLDDAAAG